ncbi:MAG: LCP family protein, partial [Roseiflexaceae bacterium]|nr:LCP family protein [Roseiflexaceae bacterium]
SPAATTRAVPTQTITPVPLDTILAITRADVAIPAARSSGAVLSNPPGDSRATTVLLMGIDRRPGEGSGTRSDTIVVLRLDPQRQRVAMLSLPRDLIVPIPGVGYARINAANVYGEQAGIGGGLELTRQTVGDLLGLEIDHVVQVDFQGFTGAVDAIGGIDIDVPTELYDPEFPTMDYGYTVAHFTTGPQHMDGARALMYARVRHVDSDFHRMRRQQSVLVAALERIRGQNIVQQLQSIADVTGALRGFIQTDLPEQDMISLAWGFRTISPAAIERYTLDENSVQINVLPEDPYAQFAVPGAIEQLSRQLVQGLE